MCNRLPIACSLLICPCPWDCLRSSALPDPGIVQCAKEVRSLVQLPSGDPLHSFVPRQRVFFTPSLQELVPPSLHRRRRLELHRRTGLVPVAFLLGCPAERTVASPIQQNPPILGHFGQTHPEVNHHGLPSAVDRGARVGPHGRPPTLGMSSTELVRVPDCGCPRWVPMCTAVHLRTEVARFRRSWRPRGVRYFSYDEKMKHRRTEFSTTRKRPPQLQPIVYIV